MEQWAAYVRDVIGADRQVVVAEKTGIDQTTISRWLHPGGRPARASIRSVAAFARGYGRPVVGAFVAAGILTEEEAEQPIGPDASTLPTSDILTELGRRAGVEPPGATGRRW